MTYQKISIIIFAFSTITGNLMAEDNLYNEFFKVQRYKYNQEKRIIKAEFIIAQFNFLNKRIMDLSKKQINQCKKTILKKDEITFCLRIGDIIALRTKELEKVQKAL